MSNARSVSSTSTRRGALVLAVFALVLALPAAGRAQTLWDTARNPALVDFDRLLLAAQFRLACSEELRRDLPPVVRMQVVANCFNAEPDELLANAHARFADLVRRAPDNVSALLGLAETLDRLGRYDAAQPLLARARALGENAPELGTILFAQATNFTRLRRFADARDSYVAYLALPLGNRARGLGLCNLAETLGSLGELERALRTYEDCIAAAPDDANGYWGLALVADRAGREDDALRAARDGLTRDPELRRVDGPDVFYVPAYEVHYYLGLAREAQERWGDARAAWQAFLDAGGDAGPWADRARAHIARLDARAAAAAHVPIRAAPHAADAPPSTTLPRRRPRPPR